MPRDRTHTSTSHTSASSTEDNVLVSTSLPTPQPNPDALASSFEALVRARQRQAKASLLPLATRVHGQWMDAGCPWLVIHAEGMAVGEGEVQLFDPEEVRWLLVLFMAGVQRLQPTPTSTPRQLSNLIGVLSQARATAAGLETLRDYFWAEAAAGFIVETRRSFTDALDVERALLAHPELFPRRLSAPGGSEAAREGSLQLSSVDTEGLDDNQVDQLAEVAGQVDEVPLVLGSDADPLTAALQDDVSWKWMELEALRAHAMLRSDLPPAELVAALDAFLEIKRVDWALTWVQDLLAIPDENGLLGELITDQQVVARLAAQADLSNPADRQASIRFGREAPTPHRGQFIAHVLRRTDSGRPVAKLVAEFEPAHVLACAPLSELGVDQTRVLLEALARSGTAVEWVAKVLARTPTKVLLSLAPTLRDDLLDHCSTSIAEAIAACVDGTLRDSILLDFARRESPASDRLIACVLPKHALIDASPTVLMGCCHAIGRLEPPGSQLVSLVHDRKVAIDVRISALTALTRYPNQRNIAATWRLNEWIYPRRLRRALVQCRKLIGEI